MKQIEAQIMGQGYVLSCPEGGEEGLLQAVDRVDQAMCKIRNTGRVKARDRIAVLVALNFAFELADMMNAPVQHVPNRVQEASAVNGDPEQAQHSFLANLLMRLDKVLAEDGKLI